MIKVLLTSQEQYDSIMVLLESQSYLWSDGKPPTYYNYYEGRDVQLTIRVSEKRLHYNPIFIRRDIDSDAISYEDYMSRYNTETISLEEFFSSPSSTNAVRLLDYNTFREFVSILTPTQKEILSEYWEKLSYKIFKEHTCITSSLNLVTFSEKLKIKRIKL